ncbi:MAG: long-chain fatty acid--CoA ligase [Deltaproteobacteria bacterium]|nr:long-chain fatty acid--CoA ligase [Deltaproteobacteria bacterium]
MEARTIVELFRRRCEASAERVALRQKRSGSWKTTTYADWQRESTRIAAGLVALGVEPGDRVAIVASTRREWVLCDMGILCAGAVTVPVYPSGTGAQTAHILSDSGARVAIVEDARDVERLLSPEVGDQLAGVMKVVVLDPTRTLSTPDSRGRIELSIESFLRDGSGPRRDWVMSLDELAAEGDRRIAKEPSVLERRAHAVHPEDPCTIVYSSGTTGAPRGVVLTHASFAFEAAALGHASIGEDDEQLLILPLAHIFGRILVLGQLRYGYRTAFAGSPRTAVDDAAEVRPTFVASVPVLYEKVHSTIAAGARASGDVKLRIFEWACAVGGRVRRLREKGRQPEGLLAIQHRYAHKLVFAPIKARLGGRIRFFFSGGAPLARDTAEFFAAAGLPLYEGYGLTETSGVATANLPGRARLGTVGRPLEGVEVAIASDGEILIRGPNLMRGYWRRPDESAAAIDEKGWLHTGDIGTLDGDGYLTITDRKKDLIVTSGGKNVAPQNIEGLLRECDLVSHAVVLGDRRASITALLTIDADAARSWAEEHGIDAGDLVHHPRLRERLDEHVEAVNARLAHHEQVRRFAVLDRDFSVETGELTPTHKVNRKVVAERFASVIEKLYE